MKKTEETTVVNLDDIIIKPRTTKGMNWAHNRTRNEVLSYIKSGKPTFCKCLRIIENDFVYQPAIGNFYFYLDKNRVQYKSAATAKKIAVMIHAKIIELIK